VASKVYVTVQLLI